MIPEFQSLHSSRATRTRTNETCCTINSIPHYEYLSHPSPLLPFPKPTPCKQLTNPALRYPFFVFQQSKKPTMTTMMNISKKNRSALSCTHNDKNSQFGGVQTPSQSNHTFCTSSPSSPPCGVMPTPRKRSHELSRGFFKKPHFHLFFWKCETISGRADARFSKNAQEAKVMR